MTVTERAVPVDAVVHARWIVPVVPAGVVHEGHALVIRDGRVHDIVRSEHARAGFSAQEVIDCPGQLLMPGLVNAHTHAPMTLFRGLADDLPLMTWLHEHIWPAEQRWVGREFVRDGARLACAEMIRGGITCFQDMYFFPDEVAAVAADAGLRAVVGLIVVEFPSAWATGPDEYFARATRVHDQFRRHPLIVTAFAPHAPYTVSDASFARVATLAEELDLQVHVHLHETEDEVARAFEQHGERPLRRLKRLQLLSPRLVAVHMTQLTSDDIALVAECGVHVVHCPESNLKLASGFCPVERLRAAGVNLALGTDGAASNNDLDLIGEMRTAALLAKAVSGDSAALPAHATLAAATLNGARALGIDHETGSLERGKAADFICLDLNHLAAQPVYDPVSQVVYAGSRDWVREVWVRGRPLLRDGRLTSIDEQALRADVALWRERIAASDRGAT